MRGPNVIPGYYKNDEKNKETFEDGWCKSGDIVMMSGPTKHLTIIDRKKNIFKLSQGEYIAPEKLETVYKKSVPGIENLFVYGDSHQSYLVAIVNMSEGGVKKLAQENGIELSEDLKKTANSEAFKDILRKAFARDQKKAKFNGLERIKKFFVDIASFEQLGLLTNSFKLKRKQVIAYYKDYFDQMYE